MYSFIKGKLFQSKPSSVTLDCQGVGYLILIPTSVFSHLPQVGKEVMLHTSFVVREQSQALYGFLTGEERDFFERLLNVNGIGPKTALSLIGHLPLANFEDAIRRDDTSTICKVPGVGKKTAQKLLIEMKDKLSLKGAGQPSDWQVKMEADPRSQTIRDAMSALINLGYNQNVAEKAIEKTLKNVPEGIDLGKLITAALKNV